MKNYFLMHQPIDDIAINKMVLASDAGLHEAATDSYGYAVTEGNNYDMLDEGRDKVDELKDAIVEALESDGLTPKGLQYLQMSLRNIVGRKFANKHLPSMESAERADPHLIARIAMEGVKETIKQFWDALKNTMMTFWNATKTWCVKTFDVANKIIARAKALEEKTNAMTTAPTEKTFEFSSVKLIAVNYQVKDVNACIKGLEGLKLLQDTILVSVTKQNQNDKSEKMISSASKMVQMLRSSATQDAANLPQIYSGSQIGEAMKGAFLDDAPKYDTIVKEQTDPEMQKKLGIDTATQAYAQSVVPYPGNRSFFAIYSTQLLRQDDVPTNIDEMIQKTLNPLKSVRWLLADTAAKPKEMEDTADVPTLASGQVSQIAQLCGEMGESILKYKKEFEARDKYVQRVIKGFDQVMKELENADEVNHASGGNATDDTQRQAMKDNAAAASATDPKKQANSTAETKDLKTSTPVKEVDKAIGKLSQTILGLFKKNMSISGAVISHSTKVCSAFLSYGEKSASMYGG